MKQLEKGEMYQVGDFYIIIEEGKEKLQISCFNLAKTLRIQPKNDNTIIVSSSKESK